MEEAAEDEARSTSSACERPSSYTDLIYGTDDEDGEEGGGAQEDCLHSDDHARDGSGSSAVGVLCADPERQLLISPRSIQMLEETELLIVEEEKRRRWKMAAIFSCAALLLTALVYMLYPQMAHFSMDSFDIDADNSTFVDEGQLVTNWIANVVVENRNFYPVRIHEMLVTVFIDDNRIAPVGRGHGSNLYFPSRSTSRARVSFSMPVYAPSSGLPSLVGECMARDRVPLFLVTDIDLSLTHWSGKWLRKAFTTVVECKIPA